MESKILKAFRYSCKKTDARVEILDTEKVEGVNRLLIGYETEKGEKVRSFLFLPETKEKVPLAVALHPHDFDYSIGKSEVAGYRGDVLKAYGKFFAQKGFAVICLDFLCFESRRELPFNLPENAHNDDDEKNRASYLMYDGSSLCAKALNDGVKAIDASLTFDCVDENRVFSVGYGTGGRIALLLALADQRVKGYLSFESAMLVSERKKNYQNIDCMSVFPGMLPDCDYDKIFASVAPKFGYISVSEKSCSNQEYEKIVECVQDSYKKSGGIFHAEFCKDVSKCLDYEKAFCFLKDTEILKQ